MNNLDLQLKTNYLLPYDYLGGYSKNKYVSSPVIILFPEKLLVCFLMCFLNVRNLVQK